MKETIEKVIAHPAEKVFGIPEGTTVIEYDEVTTDIVVPEVYDDKDNEIDSQFQQIADAAMTVFELQKTASEDIDPKYAARNMEVASMFLNTALDAIKQKAQMKQAKDKHVNAKPSSVVTTNNVIISDRKSLLAQLLADDEDEGNTYDAE